MIAHSDALAHRSLARPRARLREPTPRSSTTGAPALYSEARAELTLVARAQRGESEAMEQILAEHQGRIRRLTQSIVPNPLDAEEVAQDVMVTVWSKIDRFRGDASLTTWIHRMAVNRALMHKGRDRAALSLSLDEDRPGDRSNPQGPAVSSARTHRLVDPTLRGEFWAMVWQAADRLDDKYRVVFVLRDVEGMTTAETARALGLRVPAVKSRLHRARKTLREQLSAYFNEKAMGEELALIA